MAQHPAERCTADHCLRRQRQAARSRCNPPCSAPPWPSAARCRPPGEHPRNGAAGRCSRLRKRHRRSAGARRRCCACCAAGGAVQAVARCHQQASNNRPPAAAVQDQRPPAPNHCAALQGQRSAEQLRTSCADWWPWHKQDRRRGEPCRQPLHGVDHAPAITCRQPRAPLRLGR